MNYTMKPMLMLMLGFVLALTACQEDLETLNRTGKVVVVQPSGPGGKKTPPTEMPSPKISSRYFTAQTAEYQGCFAWRIEWPDYPAGTDPDAIPTYFAVGSGYLNSLTQLENAPVATKEKASFSLYTDERIKSAVNDLDLWGNQFPSGEAVYFGKINKTKDQIEKWVTNRPSNFELNWKYVESVETNIEYQAAGDFYIVNHPSLPTRYGGIRIVSMAPRIIEVYLADPS